MPKQSQAALSVVSPIKTLARLKAPQSLTTEQRRLWHIVVDNLPGDYFTPDQVPQLIQYVTHQSFADSLADKLQSLDVMEPAWPRLSAAQVSQSKAAMAAARSLRLTNQARKEPDTARNASRRTQAPTVEQLRQRYEHEG